MSTNLEDKALQLLTAGLATNKVAEALGVTPARISQLMENQAFKERLAEEKFSTLVKYNKADTALDSLEQRVLGKLDETIDMVFDPMKLAKVFQVLNGAKRRGTSILTDLPDQGSVVPLTLPQQVANTFVLNINNQVVKAGGEELITMQPNALKELLNAKLIESSESSQDYPSGPSKGTGTMLAAPSTS